jgi:hypothetical protein
VVVIVAVPSLPIEVQEDRQLGMLVDVRRSAWEPVLVELHLHYRFGEAEV